jgi:nucleoside-diphosphate-sugar epimerase
MCARWMAREGGALQLSVVNPVGVFGPVLGPDYSASIGMLKRMIDGAMPGCPHLYFGVVDVRDVADLHLRAMTDPAAAGERFLAVAGASLSVRDLAILLKKHLGPAARKVSTRELPDGLMRVLAWVKPEIKQFLPELGKIKNASHQKAKRLLGWSPRSSEDAIAATAESLLRLGHLTGS